MEFRRFETDQHIFDWLPDDDEDAIRLALHRYKGNDRPPVPPGEWEIFIDEDGPMAIPVAAVPGFVATIAALAVECARRNADLAQG